MQELAEGALRAKPEMVRGATGAAAKVQGGSELAKAPHSYHEIIMSNIFNASIWHQFFMPFEVLNQPSRTLACKSRCHFNLQPTNRKTKIENEEESSFVEISRRL